MPSNYWRKREEAHIKKQVQSDKEISKEIERRLQLALDDVKKEIDANFANYSSKEGISLSEAHKRANKMDVEAFARKAKEYVKTKDFSSEANYQLKIYNLTMRVSRLELLKAQIGLELVATTNDLDKYLINTLTDDALAEFERQAGILGDTISNNYKGAVDAIVNGSFNSATFSENIWRYQAELKAELDKLLVRQFAQGRNPRVMARYLRDKFEVTKGQAERLMRTESARIQTEIQKQSYQDYKIDEYEYIAEPSACSICKPLDGKIFKVKNMDPGSNSTPMHPNCRCSTAAYVDRNEIESKFRATELLELATKAEPKITEDLKAVASDLGSKLDGLDFRLKTYDSLLRKTRNEPGAKMRDVARYTSISEPDNMTSDFNKFVDELASRGYNVSAVKNYWNNSSNPYNGINANFYTPENYEFELQFHTQESFNLKNGKLHELYEKSRVISDKTSKEYISIQEEMFDLSESLNRPKGINSIKEVK